MSTSNSTLWTRGPGDSPLYSDWKVSFTTTRDFPTKDTDSVSTASLSCEEDSLDERDQYGLPNQQSSHDEEQREELFTVHRNMIGPKSVFFTECFVGSIGSTNSSCVIALPADISSRTFASVMDAFEVLLDGCYNGTHSFAKQLTTKNAIALSCLCNYFKMNSEICEIVHQFIKSDLSYHTIAEYYQTIKDMRSSAKTALVLDTKHIMEMVLDLCLQEPTVLGKDTDLFKIADLTLWSSLGPLLTKYSIDHAQTSASRGLSENLTCFFDTHQEEEIIFDFRDNFQALTEEGVLPEVSPKVALRLLEHEHKLGLECPSQDEGNRIPSITEGDNDKETPIEAAPWLTNLQERCIKALGASKWSGEENNVDVSRGKLLEITTPAVLEALLIDSVSNMRAMMAEMEQLRASLDTERKAFQKEKELFELERTKAQDEVTEDSQELLTLQLQLGSVRKEASDAKKKLKKTEEKAKREKLEMCKTNGLLKTELDIEKKRTEAFKKRYREIETTQHKIKSDRENYELTIKETIKQLDAITTYDEPYGGCGMGHFIMLISSISDRRECRQIKNMLEKVVKDPQSYVRDYLTKDPTRRILDDGTITDGETFFKSLDDGESLFTGIDDDTITKLDV